MELNDLIILNETTLPKNPEELTKSIRTNLLEESLQQTKPTEELTELDEQIKSIETNLLEKPFKQTEPTKYIKRRRLNSDETQVMEIEESFQDSNLSQNTTNSSEPIDKVKQEDMWMMKVSSKEYYNKEV